MYVPTSYAITGEGYRWENIGAMMNRGVEVAVDGNVTIQRISLGILVLISLIIRISCWNFTMG